MFDLDVDVGIELNFVMTQRHQIKKRQRNKSSLDQINLLKKTSSKSVSATPSLPNMDGSMIVHSESTTHVPNSDSVTHELDMSQTQQSSQMQGGQMDPSKAGIMQQIVNESHFAGSQSILNLISSEPLRV